MNHSHLLVSAFGFLLSAFPVLAQTQLVNPTPKDCCNCITVKISAEKDPAAPDHLPNPVFAGITGNFSFDLDVSLNDTSSFDCSQVNITSISLVPVKPPGDPSEVPVLPIINNAFSGKVTVTGEQALRSGTRDWKVKVVCAGSAQAEPSTPESTVDWCSVPFTLGRKGCGGCYGGTDAPEGSNGSFTYELPLGKANAGDTSGLLRFFTKDYSDFGPAKLAAFVPDASDYTVTRSNGVITAITTPTTLIEVNVINAKSFTVTHRHANVLGTPSFRVTTFSLLDTGIPNDPSDDTLRADSTFENSTTTRHEQTRSTTTDGTATTSVLKTGFFLAANAPAEPLTASNTLREEILVSTTGTAGGMATETHLATVAENGVVVSATATTYTQYPWGWETTRQVVDPDRPNHTGAKLASDWEYYLPGLNVTAEQVGKLKLHTRYDGHREFHNYTLSEGKAIHTTQLPFASDPQGLTVISTWQSVNGKGVHTQTSEVGGLTLSQQTTTHDSATTTTSIQTGTDAPLVTTTILKPFGSEFGGQPASVTHPDGTVTTYTYQRNLTTGVKTVTTLTGTSTDGTTETTHYNAFGAPVSRTASLVRGGVSATTDQSLVTLSDAFGRPQTTSHFNGAYTTSQTYSCCGLATSTDMHGLTTHYAYDGLRRQIKSNTLDVTTQTTHNGLTTETRRYPESVTGDLSPALNTQTTTLIAKSTRNLAGTSTTSESPNPASTSAGALTATTTTTTYSIAGTTTTTAVGTDEQTTLTYPDGRPWKTYGGLAPSTEHAYAVNTTGLISASAYLDGTALKEITATQTDWAGRNKVTGNLPDLAAATLQNANNTGISRTFTHDTRYFYNDLGQLTVVRDADNVVTLYGYNALGERDTTALSLNGDETIDYGTAQTLGTDRITRTETAPFARDASTTVLRTTTRVWRDTDTGLNPADGFLVSTADRTSDGSQSWSKQAGQPESHSSETRVSTVGFNFCGNVAAAQASDAPADGFANWADSWLVGPNLFLSGTDVRSDGTGSPLISWLAASTGTAASANNNEQAPYHQYLGDDQSNPTTTNLGGTAFDGIGTRVRISGLAAWLAAKGHTGYRIRVYMSALSGTSFRQVHIRAGDASGTVLDTLAPAVLGTADYPSSTALPGSAATIIRGYADSAAALSADIVTITIPVGDATARGTLAAIRITGTGTAATAPTSGPVGSWVESSQSPDGARSVTSYSGGRPMTQTRYGADNAPLGTVTQGYDALGRPAYTMDSRTGLSSTAYLSATCDAVASVKDPGSRTTSFTYDSRGNRLTTTLPTTLPDVTSVMHTSYDTYGRVRANWGSQTNPVFHEYDYAGRLKTLYTWKITPTLSQTTLTPPGTLGTPAAPVATRWQYDPDTGLLTGKFHDYKAGNTDDGPTYAHTAAGRLQTRTWKRGIITGYYYDTAGDLRAIDYPDSSGTPDILYTRDRLGRVNNAAQGTLNTAVTALDPTLRSATYGYNADLQLETETTNLGGGFPQKTLTRHYDDFARPRSLALGTDYTTAYGYDNAGRLDRVWDRPLLTAGEPPVTGSATFTYGYLPNSANLLHTITKAAEDDNPVLVATRTWEPTRDVLETIANNAGDIVRSSYDYSTVNGGVNSIGQRKGVATTFNLGVSTPPPNPPKPGNTSYGYDSLGQLIAAATPVATEHHRYQYDDIGNRLTAATGDWNPALTVFDPDTTTSYFGDTVATQAGANALNQYAAVKVGAANPLLPQHDVDGNLRFDGGVNGSNPVQYRECLWDAENRLIEVKIAGGATLVTYAYDHLSRLISRGEGVSPTTWTRYLYDGWNRIAEYNFTPANPPAEEIITLSRTNTWGLDLSGTIQGAGGVGGLLAVRQGGVSYYPTYDGNGNISEYLGENGIAVAHFEYDPFGNLVVDSFDNAADFPYRFSTKPQDMVSGWYYYGYRWYDPLTGRWPSRDPIEEEGGGNLYGFVGNDGISDIDVLGQQEQQKPHFFADGGPFGGDPHNYRFVLDGNGGYKVVYGKVKGKLAEIAAQNHELRHIASVKASSDANAVPYKQAYCLSKGNVSERYYIRFDKGNLNVEGFMLGQLLWLPDVAVQYSNKKEARIDEQKETTAEIAELEGAVTAWDNRKASQKQRKELKMKSPPQPNDDDRARIGSLKTRLYEQGDNDYERWTAFKDKHILEKNKAIAAGWTWTWVDETKVYKTLLKP